MQLDLKYRVLIGVSAMTLLFVSFLLSYISSQKKKMKYRHEMDELKETQQNQLLEAAIRSEEIERHRIAEALHDEVGAILSSAKLHITGIKSSSLDNRDTQLFEKSKLLLDEAIQKVRGISHNLHSNILKEFGLHEAIRHFVNNIAAGNIIRTSIDFDEKLNAINTVNDISIYRLIQELVNNILKHTLATEMKFSSTHIHDTLSFSIFHNGHGITNKEFEHLRYKKNGLGLKNIQNRLVLLKGRIYFLKVVGGYEINFDVPINHTL